MSLKEYLKTPLGIIKIKTFNKKLVEIKFIKSKKKYTNPNKPSEYYKYVKKLFRVNM